MTELEEVTAIEEWVEEKLMDIDYKRAHDLMEIPDYIKNDVYEELQAYIKTLKADD